MGAGHLFSGGGCGHYRRFGLFLIRVTVPGAGVEERKDDHFHLYLEKRRT